MCGLRTNLVRVAPSKIFSSDAGLFACEDIEEGTVVASFGVVRHLREGEEGSRTQLGYSFIVKEREGQSLTITPKHGITENLPLTTRVILVSRIVGLCTGGSKGVSSWGSGARTSRGVEEGGAPVRCLLRRRDSWREMQNCLRTIELIFVSARTNKRHHHHHQVLVSWWVGVPFVSSA